MFEDREKFTKQMKEAGERATSLTTEEGRAAWLSMAGALQGLADACASGNKGARRAFAHSYAGTIREAFRTGSLARARVLIEDRKAEAPTSYGFSNSNQIDQEVKGIWDAGDRDPLFSLAALNPSWAVELARAVDAWCSMAGPDPTEGDSEAREALLTRARARHVFIYNPLFSC